MGARDGDATTDAGGATTRVARPTARQRVCASAHPLFPDSRCQTAHAPPFPAVVAMIAATVASRALRPSRLDCLRNRAPQDDVLPSLPCGRREGAKRREALVRIAAPFACHDAAREKHRPRCFAPNHVGRSPLGASPRRLSAAGPDARLLWHHSLGMVPRRWVVVPRGGIPWPPERRITQNPARRRRSRLRSSGLSPPEAPSSSRDGRRLAPQFWKAETNRRLARSYPQAAFLIFEKSLVPDQLGRSMERMSFL